MAGGGRRQCLFKREQSAGRKGGRRDKRRQDGGEKGAEHRGCRSHRKAKGGNARTSLCASRLLLSPSFKSSLILSAA